MKNNILILATVALLSAIITSCSSVKDSSEDSYFGYSNKPPKPEPQVTVVYEPQTYTPTPVISAPTEPPAMYTQEVPVVQTEYVYFNPIVYHGYYPWWAPEYRWTVVPARRSGISISYSYGYYDIWDDYWYNYYYPRHYYTYYPYPVYHHPYYWDYPYHHGWHSVPYYGSTRPNYGSTRPQKNDTYRDFGPSRGGAGSTGNATTDPPKNRRSGTSDVPSTNTGGVRTVYDAPERGTNVRSGSTFRETPTSSAPSRTTGTEAPVRGTNDNEVKPSNSNIRSGSSYRETPSNNTPTRSESGSGVKGGETEIKNRGNSTPSSEPSPRRYEQPAPSRESTPRSEPAPRRVEQPAPNRESSPRSEPAPRRSEQPAPSRSGGEFRNSGSNSGSRESSRPSKNDDSSPNRRSR